MCVNATQKFRKFMYEKNIIYPDAYYSLKKSP